MDYDATESPGYSEALMLPASQKAQFKVNQPQFHWNLVVRLKNQIREKNGEATSWREMVKTLLSEKSWLILERGNSGEPYGSLALLIEEGMGLTVDEFTDAVARFAGPDMVDMLAPFLSDPSVRNPKGYATTSPRVSAQRDREATAAPELAIRLRAMELITQRDMEYLGRLRGDEAHQETLGMILDRIEEIELPPAAANRTERRRYREAVQGIIRALCPQPSEPSRTIWLSKDPASIVATLQERLEPDVLEQVRALLCSNTPLPSCNGHKPQRDRCREDALPTYDDAAAAVRALEPNTYATTKQVFVLTGQRGKFATFSCRAREALKGKEDFIISNGGWAFRKKSPAEMQAEGLPPKAASWEVLSHG
jgi:hypothetical protein